MLIVVYVCEWLEVTEKWYAAPNNYGIFFCFMVKVCWLDIYERHCWMHVSNGEAAFSELLNGTVPPLSVYRMECDLWGQGNHGTRSWISALCERHLMRKSNIIIIIRVPSHLPNTVWNCFDDFFKNIFLNFSTVSRDIVWIGLPWLPL